MKFKSIASLLSILVVFSLMLAACAPQEAASTEEPVTEPQAPAPEATEASMEATEEPEPAMPESDRLGAWVDEVIFTEENSAEAAASQLNAGQLDIYAYTVAEAPVFETVKASEGLSYSSASGSDNAIMFNPAEFASGELNPFSDQQMREAMHYVLDRDYIVQEIYKGLAIPKYSVLSPVFPDYARYADIMRTLEAKYAYDFDKGLAIVDERMAALGAEKVDGKWNFNGSPISLKFVIRTEDNRLPIGDYFAGQLELLGFEVERLYKNRTEASPYWVQSDPAEGTWHIYTAGWISPSIIRDEGVNFSGYFTPRGFGIPLWQAYTPPAEFDEVALKLESNDFKDLAERRALYEVALPYSLSEAYEIWVVSEVSFSPYVSNLGVASDLAGGTAGSFIWAQTMRFDGQEGGIVRVAQPGILVEPWNPVGGSNWIYDSMPQRGLSDNGAVPDPFTGLALPQRLEKAEVVVEEGLPVTSTLDWVDLKFESSITVPEDAWLDWDATEQRFITVGEAYPDGLTSKTKTTVYYPEGMFDSVTWHDGTHLSAADFVMSIIMLFDPAKEESAIYDEAAAPATEGFQSHFRGVRVVSTDPLVIETYDDAFLLDAEVMVTQNNVYPNATWWPQYAYGEGAWHSIALGILAESNGELAFSTDKAGALEVEWLSMISGPSLEILEAKLAQAQEETYIPFAATLGKFISSNEAAARYAALGEFYGEHSHFWVNTGPFVLDKVFPVEGTLTLKRNEAYTDGADKWAGFSAPKIAEVELDGAGQVQSGTEATFDVFISFEGETYATDDISEVKYLLFNATGDLVASGEAEAAGEGLYSIVLSADQTSQLESGSNKLEAIVVSSVVSIPSFASYEFVTTK
ncbi:MAG TPA: ABC transporter substrate-binding protein [Anaerolineales bacterium]|nr:ABC transporter substrate-binding protein [Anaerolineales bacterium]